MGTTLSTIKALFAPALISLIIFLILTYVIVPCWTRYRNRYAQYLPLDTLQNQTLSLRGRLHGAFSRLMAWSIWRARRNADRVVVADRGSFDSEAGEELGAVDEETARRMRNQHGGRSGVDSTRRLSRDLEEGFMDSSDGDGQEEEEEEGGGRRRGPRGT